MILQSLSDAGGADYLRRQSKENPGAYMALVGKVLPLQMTGPNGDALAVNFSFGKGDAGSES